MPASESPDLPAGPGVGELPSWLRLEVPTRRPGPARPRPARGEDMAERLLEAGRTAFRVKGYDAARVDDIVTLAGASHGTFYLYFRNKEDLLHKLAIGCARDVRVMADQLDLLAVPPAVGQLAEWVDGFIESYGRNGPVIRVWLERRDLDPLMQALADEVLGRLSDSLGRLVDPAIDAAIGPGLVRLSLMAMLERLTSYFHTSESALDRAALVATQASMFAAVMNPGDRTGLAR